jgi:predicted  nucleic acid-binding Zn-ribbon protein
MQCSLIMRNSGRSRDVGSIPLRRNLTIYTKLNSTQTSDLQSRYDVLLSQYQAVKERITTVTLEKDALTKEGATLKERVGATETQLMTLQAARNARRRGTLEGDEDGGLPANNAAVPDDVVQQLQNNANAAERRCAELESKLVQVTRGRDQMQQNVAELMTEVSDGRNLARQTALEQGARIEDLLRQLHDLRGALADTVNGRLSADLRDDRIRSDRSLSELQSKQEIEKLSVGVAIKTTPSPPTPPRRIPTPVDAALLESKFDHVNLERLTRETDAQLSAAHARIDSYAQFADSAIKSMEIYRDELSRKQLQVNRMEAEIARLQQDVARRCVGDTR